MPLPPSATTIRFSLSLIVLAGPTSRRLSLSQAQPIGLVIGLGGLPRVSPGDVRERTFGDHAHPPSARSRDRELDRRLVRDTDRGLECIETAALDGVARRLAVAAVAD